MIGLSAAEAGANVPVFGERIDGVIAKLPADALAVAGLRAAFGSATGVPATCGASFASGVRATAVPRFLLARCSATSVGCGTFDRKPVHTGIGTEACSGPSRGPAT